MIKTKVAHSAYAIYRGIFARPRFQKFNRFLYNCAIRGMGVSNFGGPHITGEHHLQRYALKKVRHTPIVFDVGANEGTYSKSVLKIRPDATIFAFEPNPPAYKRLEKSLGNRVRCQNIGLSNVEAATKIYDRFESPGSEHASLYCNVLTNIHNAKTATFDVKLRTLDDFCQERGVEVIDLLKIDTEGHELSVLRGARRMISAKRLAVIQIEFNEMAVASRTFVADLQSELPAYRLFRVLPNGFAELPAHSLYREIFGFQNLVALPNV